MGKNKFNIQIIQDNFGHIEQGFYGVFLNMNNTKYLLNMFQFKKEAKEYAKHINLNGINYVNADEYNGILNNQMP